MDYGDAVIIGDLAALALEHQAHPPQQFTTGQLV
jgi:hypothetical protein